MYWTEDAIKSKLDGNFFAVNLVTGSIESRVVPKDYIPTHTASYQGDFASLSDRLRKIKGNPWLPEQDERLIAMRARGVKWSSIRKFMQRGEKSVKERYVKLCQERGMEPLLTPFIQAPALTTEAKAEIIVLRRQGFSPSEVAEMTGRPAYQVLDYYNRFLASKRLREVV